MRGLQPEVAEYIDRHRGRALAAILEVVEWEIEDDPEGLKRIKSTVKREITELVHALRELIESLQDQSVVFNGRYLERLDEIHAALMERRDAPEGARAPAARAASNGARSG